MSSQSEPPNDSQQRMRRLLRRWGLGIFALVLTVGIFFILAFDLVRGPQVSVTLGEPAPQDVVAPRSMTYVSNVLTDEAKDMPISPIVQRRRAAWINLI